MTINVPSVFQRFLVGASAAVAKHYRKFLLDGTTLQDLPDEPRFVFNATSLKTGVLWRFSKRCSNAPPGCAGRSPPQSPYGRFHQP